MTTLYVPVQLDALALTHGRQVVGPTADFEMLPWFDGFRDRFPDTPNVASEVNAEPFADHSLFLQSGTHLHWTLPAGLTRGTSDPDATGGVAVGGLRFPAAPNRWLVANLTTGVRWMVESDYVHPHDEPDADGIAYPLHDDSAHSGSQPRRQRYVRLGRQLSADEQWSEATPSDRGAPATYLPDIDDPLTALGHLEPSFAALYGNCRTVFGAHDPAPPTGATDYLVVGFYSAQVTDPLAELLDTVATWSHRDKIGRLNTDRSDRGDEPYEITHQFTADDHAEIRRLAILERFGWTITASDAFEDPTRIACFGTVRVDADDVSAAHHDAGILTEPVAVGNSAGEALAAMVADVAADPDLEEQIEALQVGVAPDHHAFDLAAKFREHRHSAQFVESGRRRVWSIRSRHDATAADPAIDVPADPATTPEVVADDGAVPALPADLAHMMHALNEWQHRYDLAGDEIDARCQELFADWHHSMVATYAPGHPDDPDITLDALTDLIDREGTSALRAARELRGVLDLQRRGDGRAHASWTHAVDRADADADFETIAQTIGGHLISVAARLAELNVDRPTGRELEAALVPGPRFWRPRDPVIGLRHPLLTEMTRYGTLDRDGQVMTSAGVPGPDIAFLIPLIGTQQMVEAVMLALGRFDPRVWSPTVQPASTWNPLLLEWQVEVRAIAEAGNQRAAGAGYDPAFVRTHYVLPEARPDSQRVGDPDLAPSTEYLSGRTVLQPDAAGLVVSRIDLAIERLENRDDPVPAGLRRARDMLVGDEFRGVLTQSLGGFHDGLLMTRAERQLAIDDPIGFADQRRRADEVRELVGGHPVNTPRPDAAFHPIRSGEMAIQRLRIVDTFGQTVEWRPHRLQHAQSFIHSRNDRVTLPLRISQGARVDMRWVSSGIGPANAEGSVVADEVESNDHPLTSPVCGWFLTNELEGGMFVYDAPGALLGTIDADGRWRSAPGASRPIRFPYEIADRHLAARVSWIIDADDPAATLAAMVDAIDTAMEAIDPVDFAQHSSRALLVGRPVALVRARLELRLQGRAATDRSWEALRHRLLGQPPDDHGFAAVKLPIRIGGHDQRNDGVVGYWADEDDVASQHFIAAHGGHVTHRDPTAPGAPLDTHVDLDAGLVWRSFTDPALTVSMLVDPRAAVHVTTGVLPVKALTIPPEYFADALAQLRVTFATMPVLTSTEVELPLPTEPGLSWAWLQRDRTGWTETPEFPVVQVNDLLTALPGGSPDVWDDLVDRGIVVLFADDPSRGRLHLPSPGDTPIDPDLLRTLHTIARAVAPTTTRPVFGSTSMLRDGWLQLRKSTT